ncbi:unnamed protein product [Didymodactylos carnosus]|uniref:Uncharacterized protein n=1 Tax=Didymodactylos carnosus TaxID=1234261 RepID=A0A8S2HR96_9BILA|nr:unnamed protein product [Didymodactylos carnosus]CAF3670371.1 unnamed protein product [Didymodactylos carnosus]
MNPLLADFELNRIVGEYGKNWKTIADDSGIPTDYTSEFERIKWTMIRYFVNQDDADLNKMSPGENKDVQEETTESESETTESVGDEQASNVPNQSTKSTFGDVGKESDNKRKNAKGDFGNAKGDSDNNSKIPSFIVKIFSIATEGDDGLVRK